MCVAGILGLEVGIGKILTLNLSWPQRHVNGDETNDAVQETQRHTPRDEEF